MDDSAKPPVEGIVAQLRALDGRSDADRAAYARAREARESAGVCVYCGKAIAPGEPVWMGRVRYRGFLGGWSYTRAPCHGDCCDQRLFHASPFSCVGCGRDVYLRMIPNQYMIRHAIACSDACRYAHRLAALRHPRPVLALTCPVCGKEFTAARENARTCGSVCRQKDYRRRVTGERLSPGE